MAYAFVVFDDRNPRSGRNFSDQSLSATGDHEIDPVFKFEKKIHRAMIWSGYKTHTGFGQAEPAEGTMVQIHEGLVGMEVFFPSP